MISAAPTPLSYRSIDRLPDTRPCACAPSMTTLRSATGCASSSMTSLEFQVVAAVVSAEAAMFVAERERIDVAVVDTARIAKPLVAEPQAERMPRPACGADLIRLCGRHAGGGGC